MGKILWCDGQAIRPYFIAAGKALTYGNLRRQLADSLEDVPFPPLPEALLQHTYFAFGSIEDHLKYRDAVRAAYPQGHFPVLEGHNHMQFQIKDPEGFAAMLCTLIEQDHLPELPFLQQKGAAMRQNAPAWEVRDHLKTHPDAAVVNLGCGLDNTGRSCDSARR